MKTNKSLFYTITVCALMLSSTIAVAQTALRSAYYSENYLYRHQLNPALESNRDYFSFILGGINIQSNSDIPLNKLFYPRNGELVTFMHPTIGKEFLDDLSDNNRSGADINMTLASVGFHAFKGFNTVEMNIRASAYTNTPKGLYEFMKLGTAKEHYEFDHLGTNSESFIEVALGHQHNINQNLSVGGKIKFLLG
ncbi:MAG: hypothetical protein HUK03_07180, partial [Bacteroidaceae bacterium]|nr:hypothetical protein [Bacteroidaceae bacterium]